MRVEKITSIMLSKSPSNKPAWATWNKARGGAVLGQKKSVHRKMKNILCSCNWLKTGYQTFAGIE